MWVRLTVGAIGIASVIGCSAGVATTTTVAQSGQSNGLQAVAGSYGLLSIDDHSLPYTPPSKDAVIVPTQAVSGALTLNANGTFAISTTYRTVDDQGERRFDGQFSGACARDGDAYRMFWDGGGETAVQSSGDTLLVNRDGLIFRYLKRR
jgi:hypothetical protein